MPHNKDRKAVIPGGAQANRFNPIPGRGRKPRIEGEDEEITFGPQLAPSRSNLFSPLAPEEQPDEILLRRGFAPGYEILIGGKSLRDLDLLRFIMEVRVIEREDDADVAFLKFKEANILVNRAILNTPAFINISTGYQRGESAKLQSRGRFILSRSSIFIDARTSTLELVAVGEESLLGIQEKRRAWRNVTDSEIAKRIADERSFIDDVDIEDTDVRYDSVIQAGLTDWEFLKGRAALHGFQLFMRDGVLHFHSLRSEETGVKLNLGGRRPNAVFLSTSIEHFRGRARWEATFVDPFTAEIVSAVHGFKPDEILKEEADRTFSNKVLNAEELSITATQFLFPKTSSLRQAAVEKELEAAGEAGLFIVKAQVKATAVEIVRHSMKVELTEIGRLNGKYHVREVEHVISPFTEAGYSMILSLRRTFTGEVKEEDAPADVTNRSAVVTIGLAISFDDIEQEFAEVGQPSTDPLVGFPSTEDVNEALERGFVFTGIGPVTTRTKSQIARVARPSVYSEADTIRVQLRDSDFNTGEFATFDELSFGDGETVVNPPPKIEEVE